MKLTYGQYQIFDHIPGFVYFQASDYSIVHANKRFIELFGEPNGRHCYELMENRDKPCKGCPTFNIFSTKKPQRRRWESSSGRVYKIFKNFFVDDEGRGLVLKIGMDITEEEKTRNEIEELTRQQKEQIKIIDSGPAVVFLRKAIENWPVVTVSSNVVSFGYEPDDFITGRVNYADIIHPDDLAGVFSEVKYNSKNHIDDYIQDYRIFGKDRTEHRVEDHTLIRRDESGEITHYEGIVLDITERKKTEDALMEKTYVLNKRVKELMALTTISDLIWSSVPPEDMFRGVIDTIIPAMQYPESTSARIVFDGREFKNKGFVKSDWKIGKKLFIEGEKRGSLEVYYKKKMPDRDIGPFYFEEDNMLDIICRRLETHLSMQLSQEKLKKTLNRLNNIINFLPDATFVVDKDSGLIAWNRAIEQMTGIPGEDILVRGDFPYEYALNEEKLPDLIDYILHPEDMIPEQYEKVKEEENYISAESYLAKAFGGRGAYVLVIASVMYDENGNIEGAIESIRDISELKMKEMDLVQSLEDKNAAITEIHHRVKNNLQVISALVQMHYHTVGEEKYAELFENLNNRVIAIARAYENLIEREDFLEIYMPNLVDDLISSTMLSQPHTTEITIEREIIDEILDLNTAVSLSMIISELFINIIKHAFVGREKGHVKVYFQREGDDEYILEISDDGVGYRGETDLSRAKTLGMRLVGILVERDLHGTVDIAVDGGTKFTIKFEH